jgi:hypothetical protein
MGMLFGTGVPVLIPLCFINIISRYITTRSLLQHCSSRIDGLGEDFMSFTFWMFPFMSIVFPVFGAWMLLANSYLLTLPINFNFLPFLKGYIYELDQ